MRKILRPLLLAVASVSLVSQPTHALSRAILTDAQIESIQANCQLAKVHLNTLHNNDAVLRVNLGERYINIARRLMAPLNSRIALNGLDGVDMAKTTVLYNQGYLDFSKAYADYKTSVEAAIRTDCTSQPVEFYTAIGKAQLYRGQVAESVAEMYRLGRQYRAQLTEFEDNLRFKKEAQP